jgi:hypothetical protein
MRTITEDELKCLWMLLDETVRDGVTDEQWFWAIKIRMSERSEDQQLPIHYQVLRHLFRLENGQPNFQWGLKADLAERMSLCSTHAEVQKLEQQAQQPNRPRLEAGGDALRLGGR